MAWVDTPLRQHHAERPRRRTLQYAQRLSSRSGTQDGLYWPTTGEEPRSPLGPLVTGAERYLNTLDPGDPIHGYYYHVLTRQGDNSPGGRHDYIINGRMVAGFALLAFPAEYDNTGTMTFVVSQRGVVHQKDLGDQGSAVEEYDPDASWSAVTD